MDDDNKVVRFKITVIGESGVGKTSMVSRFINNEFDSTILSSNGQSYGSKELKFEDINNTYITLDIWDTAGQEKYRSLVKSFYKDADAAILVYDTTVTKSFEEMKKYWYEQIKEHSKKNIVIAIAGNKCDLVDDEQVKEEDAREFAKEIGAIFKLTSAITSVGIYELFKKIGYKLLIPNYDIEKLNNEDIKIPDEYKEIVKQTITTHNSNIELRKSQQLKKKEHKKISKRTCC